MKYATRTLTPDGSDEGSLESWVADEFEYTGVSFGPGGQFNSNVYLLSDYREVK